MTGAATPPSSPLRFLLPSAVGIGLFLTPVPWEGGQQIVVGLLAGSLQRALAPAMPWVICTLFLVSGVGSALATWLQPEWILRRPLLRQVLVTTGPWLTLRLLGGALSTLTALQLGPAWIIGADTGQVAYVELAGIILCIMLVANFLLPLLTDFGFLDLVGTLLERFFHRVFRLPGRAALDAVTSWVGDSSVGALLTIRQYEGGHYTAREAAAVVTNFSAVSLPFCVVIAQLAGLLDRFVVFYLTTLVCGVLCALITPRLPPLSRIADTRFPDAPEDPARGREPEAVWPRAWYRAVAAGGRGPGPARIVRHAGHTILDIYVAVLPAAMTIEFLALVVVEYTDLLTWLSLPMLPLLQLLQIPDAWAVLPGTLVGFFDQFIPAIISADVEDPVSRFVLASLSITQLIFIAENGVLILRSSIPLNFLQLATIFLLRTVISLPVLALVAHLLY
ncbi:MAG: YjiH family protein [Pseudomonadales bacterium]|jgi:nucleoside recognition membrane protein YjiH|nr:YjiH family protein [Pseudomonadales bacterium]